LEGSQAGVTSSAENWDAPRCKAADLARQCNQSRPEETAMSTGGVPEPV